MKLFTFLFTLASIESTLSAEILCIFPRPAYSHQSVFQAVTEKLLENGHKITLMSTHPNENEKNHKNVTLIDVSLVSVELFKTALEEIYDRKSLRHSIFKMIDTETILVDRQLETDGMQKLLRDRTKRFDLMILETVGMSPFHAFAEHFDIPVIGISSSDSFAATHEIMGNVMNPVAHPERVLSFTVARTFKERLLSCFVTLLMKFVIIRRAESNYEPIMKKHFPAIKKSYQELVSNVDLQLINVHPALGYLRPILPNTITLGFLQIKPPKPLPKDLQELLDKSENGVIFMSFGTVLTQKIADKNHQSFIEAFRDLPYDVFWKANLSDFDSVPSNIHSRNWFPQSDLLAHPKIKLFINHGGQHSIEESIIRNVPMIICPFHGDQEANAKRSEKKGISKTLNIHEKLDAGQIKSVITEVIASASFKINIEKLAKLVQDVPMNSSEKALWHIEFVLRNRGAKHLNYEQKDIPFYQYHYYDLILSVVALIVVILFLIYAVLRIMRWCLRKVTVLLKRKKD